MLRSSKILRHFGRLFESIELRVTYANDFGEVFTNHIMEPLSQYCQHGNLKELYLCVHLTNRITEKLQPLLLHLKCFKLNEEESSETSYRWLLKRWPNLEELLMYSSVIATHQVERFLKKNSQLKKLSVAGCGMVRLHIFRSIADHAPLIQHLEYENCSWSKTVDSYIHLSRLSNLKSLEIDAYGHTFASALAAMAAANVQLEQLKFTFNWSQTATHQIKFVEAISQFKRMKSLTLSGQTKLSASNLINILSNLNELTEFHFNGECDMTVEDFLSLVRSGEKLEILVATEPLVEIMSADLFMRMVAIVKKRREKSRLKVHAIDWGEKVPKALLEAHKEYVEILYYK